MSHYVYHVMCPHLQTMMKLLKQRTCSDIVIIFMLASLELQGSTSILTLQMNWYMYLQTNDF